MFEKAQKVAKRIKCELWGEFKTGKSAFALSFPKPCVIDTEKGSLFFGDRFEFSVKEVIRWRDLKPVMEWLKANPGKFETLVVDSVTPLYKDLIDSVLEAAKNKAGRETLTQRDWGIVKRRWNGFLQMLVELPIHVVLTVRAKDEYVPSKDEHGEDVSKRTGELIQDVDKSTNYIFDFILRLKCEADKRAKSARYKAVVEGTRRPELRKFQEFDITDRRGFDVVFGDVAKAVCDGRPVGQTTAAEEMQADSATPAAEPAPEPVPPPKGTAEQIGEMLDAFTGAGDPDAPSATAEDIKVLMTRAGQMRWPDGSKFASEDGKRLVRALYKVGSSKDLKKYQTDFLYEEFGKVLAGRAALARDESGDPFVAGTVAAQPDPANVRF